MKLLLFVFLVTFSFESVTVKAFESTFKQEQDVTITAANVVNNIVSTIRSSDPYTVADFNGTFVGFPLVAEDFTIEGFSNVEADEITQDTKENNTTISFRLTAHNITGSSPQWSSMDEHFYGQGQFEFHIPTIRLTINTLIDIPNKNMTSITVTPEMPGVQVAATGVYNDDELTNDFNFLWSRGLNKCMKEMYTVEEALTDYVTNLLKAALTVV